MAHVLSGSHHQQEGVPASVFQTPGSVFLTTESVPTCLPAARPLLEYFRARVGVSLSVNGQCNLLKTRV